MLIQEKRYQYLNTMVAVFKQSPPFIQDRVEFTENKNSVNRQDIKIYPEHCKLEQLNQYKFKIYLHSSSFVYSIHYNPFSALHDSSTLMRKLQVIYDRDAVCFRYSRIKSKLLDNCAESVSMKWIIEPQAFMCVLCSCILHKTYLLRVMYVCILHKVYLLRVMYACILHKEYLSSHDIFGLVTSRKQKTGCSAFMVIRCYLSTQITCWY